MDQARTHRQSREPVPGHSHDAQSTVMMATATVLRAGGRQVLARIHLDDMGSPDLWLGKCLHLLWFTWLGCYAIHMLEQ